MSALTFLTGLAAAELPGAVSFVPARCLRRRLHSWQCRRCVDACPREALSFHDNKIHFDRDRCSGCLACSASCPNDAFEFDGFNLERVLQSLPAQEETVISCQRQKQMHPQEHVIPCLGGLDTAHLLFIGMKLTGRAIFNASACQSCENAAASRRFAGLVSLLQDADNGALNAELVIRAEAQNYAAISPGTRRSFLAGVRKGLTAVLADRLCESAEESGDVAEHRRIPKKLKLVRGLLHKLEQKQVEFVTSMCLFAIHIGSECTACPLCKGICPTGAIRIDKSGTDKAVKIDTTRCSGCGLCASFCRLGALDLEEPRGRKRCSSAVVRCETSSLPEQVLVKCPEQ